MDQVVQLMPDEAHRIALQLHIAGSFHDAELLSRRTLNSAPSALDTMHYLAVLCHQQKRLNEAAELIQRIVDIDPSNADAYNNLGNVYEGMGDDAQAESCFRRAIELNSNHAPAHNNLGVSLAQQNRLDEAVAAYRMAAQLAPDSAEFHYNLGNALRRMEDMDGAADAYAAATRMNPDHLGAWQGLARALRLAGRATEAVEVFDNLIRLHPDNPVFKYLRAACVGEQAPDRAPDDYVTQIFDDAAAYFDSHLDALGYRAPALLLESLAKVISTPDASLDVLDAGCGTGLCGPLLRPYSRKLSGVDLSEGMLKKAAEREIYHDLHKAELTEFMQGLNGSYDVIVSADTLCYFGELQQVFHAAERALRSGGILAFTLEDSGEAVSFRLNHSGRYVHSRAYVEESLSGAGFSIRDFAAASLRTEGKLPVTGHVVVASKGASI